MFGTVIAIISRELQTIGIEYNGGKCKYGVEKHGELSPDENDLKPVNIFKDTTHITKWFHLHTLIMKHKEQS
jgi:hypothetical protein